MRDDPKPKGSVHAPVALGPLPLTDAPEFFHLLRRALAEHVGREPEHGQTALGCGLAPALLVLLSVGMLADGVVPPVHEVGEFAQVLEHIEDLEEREELMGELVPAMESRGYDTEGVKAVVSG